jgi:anti-sigma regulatory factor (Ser/Thr protein kinase)
VPLNRTDRIYAPDRDPAAISHRFVAEPQAAPAARRVLEQLLWNLDPDEVRVAALLTTELIANGIEHGAGKPGYVQLQVAVTAGRLRVAVGNEGSGFIPAPRDLDAPLDSHWGLHLVEALADRWGVVAEPQTVVWFELDRVLSLHAEPAPLVLA